MKEFLLQSNFFSVVLTLAAFETGVFFRRKTGFVLFNPLVIAIVLIIGFLTVSDVDYEIYEKGSSILSYMSTPALVSLAVPLYRRLDVLLKYKIPIVAGILAGVVTSLGSTWMLAVLFRLSHAEYVTLLPKSVTNAVGMVMSEELGGMAAVTVAAIAATGIVGNIIGERICRMFHIREKVAVGTALGTSAHAFGTVKAMELGELEGAMGSLAIVVSGLITVVVIPLFARLY